MAIHIMVVDDDPAICRLIEYQLGGAGYRVTSYQRVFDALLALSDIAPDLVLLDVMMPEMSGWDVCRQIRSVSTTPIIMLTAKHGDDDIATGLASGADDYIAKPFSAQVLIARIEAVLRRAHGTRSSPMPEAQHRPLPAPLPPTETPTPEAPAVSVDSSQAGPPRLGPLLAEARRRQRLSLHDAADACGVRWEFLQAIEREHFSFVPKRELRTALQAYGALLNVDLSPYLGRRTRQTPNHPLGPLSLTIGMVAVLVVALVLIMLAL